MDDALARALASVHTFVRGEAGIEDTLQEIAGLATEAIGADMAGLTIRDERGRATTVISTDRMVLEIDRAQYDSGRGPCLDAARTHQVLEVADTLEDPRWPEFAAAAVAHGIRSSLSMPVVVAGDGLGALNFYAGAPSSFGPAERATAGLFAGQCAIASQYWTVAHEATTLAAAMASRATIEQAKGILMASTGCTPDDAFALLREQSQLENRKLREIAEEIVSRQKR